MLRTTVPAAECSTVMSAATTGWGRRLLLIHGCALARRVLVAGGRVGLGDDVALALRARGRRAGQPYQPGPRGWLKLRIRYIREATVGAVIGRLDQPERLILGRRSPE